MNESIRRCLPALEKEEQIILVLRRHWLILFAKIAVWTIAALAPIAAAILVNGAGITIPNTDVTRAIIILGGSIYFVSMFLFLFASFVDYYLDVWVVTTERIISVEQHGAFTRTVAEQWLYRIQDVTAEQTGILPTFFNYGHVYIQTAGEQPRFTFEQVPMPSQIARRVIDTAEQCKIHHHLLDHDGLPVKRQEAQE